MENLKITYKKISEIKEYDKNPRKNDGAVDKVAASIKEFGFKNPIIIDKDGIIIAGHTRLKAAKKLGFDKVPTILADDLTDQQAKAFRIADNKVSEFADWDDELLFQELGDIPDIDMTKFGIEIIKGNAFDTEFALPDGNKDPYQQMAFTLADQQAEEIKELLKEAKEGNNAETFGNTNENGNALYKVFKEWEMLKK
jgi:ParB-like chromosome segregation protein Spo0J